LKYIFMKKGRTIETTTYNAAGKVTAKAVMLVNDVTTSGESSTATVTVQNFGPTGSLTGTNTGIYKCNNGTFIIDLASLMPQSGPVKFSASTMEFPAGMTVGQQLPSADMTMAMTMGGKAIKATYQFTDRKVVDEENVTTPAGTWKCLKITFKFTTAYVGLNMPPSNTTGTQWYAPDFALIQWQLNTTTAKITAIKD
jgi:hypothetical protein